MKHCFDLYLKFICLKNFFVKVLFQLKQSFLFFGARCHQNLVFLQAAFWRRRLFRNRVVSGILPDMFLISER